MDGQRFDELTRALATGMNRRRLLRGVAVGFGALAGVRRLSADSAEAACPPGQVPASGGRCICKNTGRPPGPSGCAGDGCGPGFTVCNGACVDTSSDPNHCGGCNQPCSVPGNATGVICRAGQCFGTGCAPGWADCNGLPGDGCETQLGTDQNCSACGDVCPSQTACVNNACIPTDPCAGINCDDGDPCTLDTCSQGVCQREPIPDCCRSADECLPPPPECQAVACVENRCETSFLEEGTACGDRGACLDDHTYQPGHVCAADGTCNQPPVQDCTPFACEISCRNTCGSDDHCAQGYRCASGNCVLGCTSDDDCDPAFYCGEDGTCHGDKGLGEPCGGPTECQSGFCVNGVCCNEVCDGTCQVCGETGECGPAADGAEFCDECAFNSACFEGACLNIGCETRNQCNGHGLCDRSSGFCVCQKDFFGDCLPVTPCSGDPSDPENCIPEPTAACVNGGQYCSGNGMCANQTGACVCLPGFSGPACNVCDPATIGPPPKLGLGEVCGADFQCASQYCVDGVCCDERCGGRCRSCARAGLIGTCGPVEDGLACEDAVGDETCCGGRCITGTCQTPG